MDDCLFAALDHFLADCRETARVSSCRTYWQNRDITRADLKLLEALGKVARCPGEVADFLGRCPQETAGTLAALSAIGLAEEDNGRYVASDAALSYCAAVRNGRV